MKSTRFKIIIHDQGKTITSFVEKDEFIVGRGKDADLILASDLISRSQIKVSWHEGNIWVEELGSSNGSWLGDAKMDSGKKMVYRTGQRLLLGGTSGPLLHIDHESLIWSNTPVIQVKNMDELISSRMAELNHLESDGAKRIKKLEMAGQKALHEITQLIQAETKYKESVTLLEQTIKVDEERLQELSSQLQHNKSHQLEINKDVEAKLEKLRLEEEAFRERNDNEALEARLKITQFNAEIQKLQSHISVFATDIANLEHDKATLHAQISDLKLSRKNEEIDLDAVKTDLKNTERSLEDVKEKIAQALRDREAEEVVYQNHKTETLDLKAEALALVEAAKAQAHSLLQENEQKVLILKDEQASLQSEIEKERTRLTRELEKSLMDLYDQKSALIKELGRMTQQGHKEYDSMIDQAQLKAKELVCNAEAEANASKQKILDSIEQESKDIRQSEQKLIAELKHTETMKIKEMRSQSEAEWFEKRSERAKSVSTNVQALITSEMLKFINKPLDNRFIESFNQEIKVLVHDTMMDKVGSNQQLQQILGSGEDSKIKEQKFWKKVQISAGASAAALIILLAFPQIIATPKEMLISAFSEKNTEASEAFLKKVQEARLNAVYKPATSIELKPSYAESILFTTDFHGRFNAQEFQDKWILELNDWFIKSLDVKDTTIIKFVSLESNLISELIVLRENIDAANPHAGIALMKAKEAEFKQKLGLIFEDAGKVSRYYDYRQDFWNKHYHPRVPASKSEVDLITP